MQKNAIVEKLEAAGWTSNIAKLLGENILKYQFTGKNVVFDFDNTVICGDIGEKVLRNFSDKHFQFKESHRGFSPQFIFKGKEIDLQYSSALKYYNYFLSYSALSFQYDLHYKSIPYAWAIQIMEGLSLNELMEITETVFPYFRNKDAPEKPFIYPAILNLIALLQEYGFNTRFISASNVWSVRKVILDVLNPELSKINKNSPPILPESIVGLEVLLQNKKDKKLSKDKALLEVDSDYAVLKNSALEDWQLTSNLNFPVTAYEGKVAAYQKHFGTEQPLFGFGDTTSDFDLLTMAAYPIWIAKMEVPSETHKVWEGWKGKEVLGENIQPIDSEHLCNFLDWHIFKEKAFLSNHPLGLKIKESLEILGRA